MNIRLRGGKLKTLTEPEIVLLCMAMERATDYSLSDDETSIIYDKYDQYFGEHNNDEIQDKNEAVFITFLNELKEDK